MSVYVEHKGWRFRFQEPPTDEELEARYEARVKQTIDIPVASPHPLDRDTSPYQSDPLEGRTIAVQTTSESGVAGPLVGELLERGADVRVPEGVADVDHGADVGSGPGTLETWTDEDEPSWDGLILDATTMREMGDCDELYEFFQPRLRDLESCARLLVVGRPPRTADNRRQAAARRATDGFVRSMAKEIGKSGATANRLIVERGAEDWLGQPLQYFSTPRSAYITGQTLALAEPDHAGRADEPDEQVFDGRAAVVTGAARGIGRSIAERLAVDGAEVLCVDLPGNEKLDEVREEFGGIPRGLDITDEQAPERIAEFGRDHDGIDILVHNAGIDRGGGIEEMEPESWRQTVDVNLEAPRRITDHLIEQNLLADGGRLVGLSSVAGLAGNAKRANYGTSKAGMIGLMRYYADRLADRGITANAIAPGFIETELTDEQPSLVRETARRLNDLGQEGVPGDVANAVTFLSTRGAQAISGDVLRVCGGFLIGA